MYIYIYIIPLKLFIVSCMVSYDTHLSQFVGISSIWTAACESEPRAITCVPKRKQELSVNPGFYDRINKDMLSCFLDGQKKLANFIMLLSIFFSEFNRHSLVILYIVMTILMFLASSRFEGTPMFVSNLHKLLYVYLFSQLIGFDKIITLQTTHNNIRLMMSNQAGKMLASILKLK